MAFFPVMRPVAVDSIFLTKRLEAVAGSRIFSNRGPQVRELEDRLADWVGVSSGCVVVCANATIGIEGAVAMSPAVSWRVPVWTFPATALAPIRAGRSVEFADIDRDDWMLTQTDSDENVGNLPVVPFGARFTLDKWRIGQEVVVDAAASLPSSAGSLGSLPETMAVIYSLHATKAMGGAEGGCRGIRQRRASEAHEAVD